MYRYPMSKGKEPPDPELEEKRRKRRENAAKKPKKKRKITVRSSEPRQWNPEPYIAALESRSYLMLIIKNGNAAERRQATAELTICDAKLKQMQDMPGFDLSVAGPLIRQFNGRSMADPEMPLGLSALAAPPAEWPAPSRLDISIADLDTPIAEPRPLEEHNPKPYDYGIPDGMSNRYKIPTLQAQVKKVKTPGPKQVTRTTPQYREAASAWWAPKLAHRKKMQKIARTHRAQKRRDKHTNAPIQIGINQMLESLPRSASEPVTGPSGVIRGRSPKR